MVFMLTSAFQFVNPFKAQRLSQFRPRTNLEIEMGPFMLRTARNPDEVQESLSLRYAHFLESFGSNLRFLRSGIVMDQYDLLSDHLLIYEKKQGKLIATFRLNSSLFAQEYSAWRRFDLHRFMEQPGRKTELSHLCLLPEYETPVVVALIWRAIKEYLIKNQSAYLFGGLSLRTQDLRTVSLFCRYIETQAHHSAPNFAIAPRLDCSVKGLQIWLRMLSGPLTEYENKEVRALLPPMLASFFKLGASISADPAWNDKYGTTEFVPVLSQEYLNRFVWRDVTFDC